MFEEISENAPEDLERILTNVIDLATTTLRARQMNEPHKALVSGLQLLLSVKSVPSMIRSRPSFLAAEEKHISRSPHSAWALQNCSLLGHVIRPTPLDEILFAQVSTHGCLYVFGCSWVSVRPGALTFFYSSRTRHNLLDSVYSVRSSLVQRPH